MGDDYRQLKFRGPGSVGTPTLTTHVGRYHIVLNSHTARTFVPRCDFISTIGWNDGGADARKKLGLPGGGPKYCITPLCVMDFSEDEKRMRLRSLHPGVTLQDVQSNTGFELLIPDEVPVTELPTKEELTVLRTRVDCHGLLRSGLNRPSAEVIRE